MNALVERFPQSLAAPSVSCGLTNLYMRGIFEEETLPNLLRPMTDLMVSEPRWLLSECDSYARAAPLWERRQCEAPCLRSTIESICSPCSCKNRTPGRGWPWEEGSVTKYVRMV